jgi:hypothetical protein
MKGESFCWQPDIIQYVKGEQENIDLTFYSITGNNFHK